MDYPWYEVTNSNDVQQGDFLFDLEIPLVEHSEGSDPIVNFETYDAIIMTQSCDIPKKSIEHLILCPVWELSKASELHSDFGTMNGKENLRLGRFTAFHLLNACQEQGFERDFMIVQFERVMELPKKSIQEFLASRNHRLRLLPPYREHLAQAFARFFMRVGLPIDIPAFRT